MSFEADFKFLNEELFKGSGIKLSDPQADAESADYRAGQFKVASKTVRYRRAKITPTKVGQFVTLWKRSNRGPIQPYDQTDKIDFFLVLVKSKSRTGLFVFPKDVLTKHGVLSVKSKGGKRAIRVYPSWDKTDSVQARKTQSWQAEHFYEIIDQPLRGLASLF